MINDQWLVENGARHKVHGAGCHVLIKVDILIVRKDVKKREDLLSVQ